MGSLESGPHGHRAVGEFLETVIGNKSLSRVYRLHSEKELLKAIHIVNVHTDEATISCGDMDEKGTIIIVVSEDGNFYWPVNPTAEQRGDEMPLMPIFPDPIDPKGF